MHSLTQSYQLTLVLLSYVIATIASFTALDMGARVTEASGRSRHAWLWGGACAMGTGIWSMHFIAMLALHLPITITYDHWLVIVSIVIAILASAIALFVISRKRLALSSLLLGGGLMGIGIAAMHYTGMAAMQMPAHIHYDPVRFALSIVVAIGVAIVAVLIAFRLRNEKGPAALRKKLFSGLVMGVAVVGMHYTGMWATTFTPHEGALFTSEKRMNAELLAYAVGILTCFILGIAIYRAIIDRRILEFSKKAKDSEQRFDSLFHNNLDAVISYNLDGKITSINPVAVVTTGYDMQELEEYQVATMVNPDDWDQIVHSFRLASKGIPQNYDTEIYHKLGQKVAINITHIPIVVNGEIEGVYAILRDITERKRTEEIINFQAFHDELTGLPNRRLLEQQLEQMLKGRKKDQSLVVMFLDTDRFKVINDSMGHGFGDKVLQSIAQRLNESVREGDIAARMGGDEFTILLPNLSKEEAIQYADRVIEALGQPLLIDDMEVRITVSIGIAVYPGDGQDMTALMRSADTAMYAAKEKGKNQYRFYESSMNEQVYERLLLENELYKALEREEFMLHYQPQVSLATNEIVGVEALVRWKHPEKGLVPPGQFIPLAEETGLIVPIGEWVLREACTQNMRWLTDGFPPLRMSVNLSTRQFWKKNIVETVAQILEETGMDPSYLELEITESIMMDVNRSISTLQALKELGVHIAIDDFGTGYSSLTYLKRFPLDRLKIDQSFVRDLLHDSHNEAIVATIISMAHHLGLYVVAEGVEQKEEANFLVNQKCDEAQGYYISRPVPADEISKILLETRTK
ncbi:MAG TPA: EAL domain-containing protein [Candidatus Bathyarchaeia archaeon]|nr:EAL domain-containing protein [Candidatus Bathyarchaeia archaeon]